MAVRTIGQRAPVSILARKPHRDPASTQQHPA